MNEHYRVNDKVLFYHFAKQAVSQSSVFLEWYNQLDTNMQNAIQRFLNNLHSAIPYWPQVAFFSKIGNSVMKEELDEILNRNTMLRRFLEENLVSLKPVLHAWENSQRKNTIGTNFFMASNKQTRLQRNQVPLSINGNSKGLYRVKCFSDLSVLDGSQAKGQLRIAF